VNQVILVQQKKTNHNHIVWISYNIWKKSIID